MVLRCARNTRFSRVVQMSGDPVKFKENERNRSQPSPLRIRGRFGRRQKRERGSRYRGRSCTGFLGAGKTTLVRRFLGTPKAATPRWSSTNSARSTTSTTCCTVERNEDPRLLGNGCICCNTRSDLQRTVKLVADRERGNILHFDRVLIETSGLTEDMTRSSRPSRPTTHSVDCGALRYFFFFFFFFVFFFVCVCFVQHML